MAKSVYGGAGEIVTRSIVGLIGGFLLANFAALIVIRAFPDGGRAIQSLAQMIGFALFGVGSVTAFSFGSTRKVLLFVGIPTVLAGLAALLLGGRA